MNFTIITPSLNQLPFIKRCVASVADQQGVDIEHIVIDGGSTDGTVEFLSEHVAKQPSTDNYQLTFASEADEGMYDALNKGFGRASGDVLAWLNCDEQLLPGALGKAAKYFTEHPEADLIYGDALLVDTNGALLTCRKNPPLRLAYVVADHLYVQSAAMFFRTGIFSSGIRFDTAWKAVGDCGFVTRILKAGFRPAQIKDYLAVCTMTGKNLSGCPRGVEELRRFRRQAPLAYRLGRPALNALRHLEKLIRGGYRQKSPLEYEIYSGDSDVRKKIIAESASCRFSWGAHE